jgi:choline dehydrogenase-like flavoprotein
VADSSVMPRVVTAPTNAATFMVAGKASQLILG